MFNKNRAKGFEIISDKTNVNSRLKCTLMYNSVNTLKKYKHIHRCRFAHNDGELEIADCAFGQSCKLRQSLRIQRPFFGTCKAKTR